MCVCVCVCVYIYIYIGISAGKQLSDAGIMVLLILEATYLISNRICRIEFAGMNVEVGANWVEGVRDSGMVRDEGNPIWTIVHHELKLNTWHSDYDHLATNTYNEEYVPLFLRKFFIVGTLDI
jgi:polyamine oxidase